MHQFNQIFLFSYYVSRPAYRLDQIQKFKEEQQSELDAKGYPK